MQRTLVLMLHDASPDLPLRAIAEQVGISESSVRRCLAYRTEDVKKSAQHLLQTMVPDAAEAWFTAAKVASRKGYHQPAKDLMEAAGAIEAKPTVAANVNVAPTVVLNMPFSLGAVPGPSQASLPVAGSCTSEAAPLGSSERPSPVIEVTPMPKPLPGPDDDGKD